MGLKKFVKGLCDSFSNEKNENKGGCDLLNKCSIYGEKSSNFQWKYCLGEKYPECDERKKIWIIEHKSLKIKYN
ncbi:MAG: hypothetical protein ABH811_00730 [archaeon]